MSSFKKGRYYNWPGTKILNRVLDIKNSRGGYAEEPYPHVELLTMRGEHDSQQVKNQADELKKRFRW